MHFAWFCLCAVESKGNFLNDVLDQNVIHTSDNK